MVNDRERALVRAMERRRKRAWYTLAGVVFALYGVRWLLRWVLPEWGAALDTAVMIAMVLGGIWLVDGYLMWRCHTASRGSQNSVLRQPGP